MSFNGPFQPSPFHVSIVCLSELPCFQQIFQRCLGRTGEVRLRGADGRNYSQFEMIIKWHLMLVINCPHYLFVMIPPPRCLFLYGDILHCTTPVHLAIWHSSAEWGGDFVLSMQSLCPLAASLVCGTSLSCLRVANNHQDVPINPDQLDTSMCWQEYSSSTHPLGQLFTTQLFL